jgi:putative nucleotidyltransferase with HDIG domain
LIDTGTILEKVQTLPTLSPVVARLSALVHDDRSSAVDFERVIRPDPALTANVLKLANSAFFGLERSVESVRQAVAVVGLKRLFELATSVVVARVIPPRLPGYEIDAAEFWRHCLGVGVMAEQLASESGKGRPELIFAAGLLHDLGKLAVGTYVALEATAILERTHGDDTAFVVAEREVLGTDHAEVGGIVAEAWGLPPSVVFAARWHHRPEEVSASEHGPLVDVVHIADGLAHSLGLGADVGELARKVDGSALARLSIRRKQLERIASECLGQVSELQGHFATAEGGEAR